MSAIEKLKAVLLDPEGNASIRGSKEDNKIIQESLVEVEKQLDLFVYDKLQQLKPVDIDDAIDTLIEALTFDDLKPWADVLAVEYDPPPCGDMWPDWEDELRVKLGEAMFNISRH